MFASALDVGSTFVDVLPEEDVAFRFSRDRSAMQGVLYLQNVTPQATVAFYVWTAEQGFRIEPEYGFIPPGGYVYVQLAREGSHADVEEKLFFVKGLPLSYDLDLRELSENVHDVFHIHNRSILFTVATCVGSFDCEKYAEDVKYEHHLKRRIVGYGVEEVKREEEPVRKGAKEFSKPLSKGLKRNLVAGSTAQLHG